ncbi:hypothetical protein K474DRAFT_1660698 [Panus rudis PR-1116 ss-1]|nr:hypothetical protein K474DRAFT_1660698 [Panus rudis PR-1116 ss-1]
MSRPKSKSTHRHTPPFLDFFYLYTLILQFIMHSTPLSYMIQRERNTYALMTIC